VREFGSFPTEYLLVSFKEVEFIEVGTGYSPNSLGGVGEGGGQ
jgi:hypothetical protein